MKKHGGTVVTIATSFENGFPMLMTGAASRAAQINMTKTLAVEWAASGIRLNVVSPGFILSSVLSAYPELDRQETCSNAGGAMWHGERGGRCCLVPRI